MSLELPRLLVQAMARHLPPSPSTLRLADVNGAAGEILREIRADLAVTPVSGEAWTLEENSVDAVAAYGAALNDVPLREALFALRPGGRLIVVDPHGEPLREHVETLETAGYTRILVEAALDDPAMGVLIRGEKPHATTDTLARVTGVARRDSAASDLTNFKGRYLHLLVRQAPNKPAWALTSEDRISWEAVGVGQRDEMMALAFSSLPNAVTFMQAAVLAGTLRDVNKVGKFSRATAEAWPFPIVINPAPDILRQQTVIMIAVDPATAEMADE